MRSTFIEVLLENAKIDSNIIFITGDLGFGVIENFQKQLPKQFINAGISEQAMMGMAAGIASTGKRVFVYSIGNFSTIRCLEQIRNDICLMNNSVIVVSVGAGYSYGNQGYTHHALEDIAVMRALPNMGVYIPADSIETRFLTNHLCKTSAPGYLRLGKNGEKNLITSYNTLIPNRITEIKRGNDGTILFVGSIGIKALIAAEILEKKGIEISVASVPFVSDIDLEYLKLAAAKGPIITVEEHSRFGGFGSLVLETLNLLCIDFNLRIVAATRNNLSEIGSQEYLRAKNGLDENSIVEAFNSFR